MYRIGIDVGGTFTDLVAVDQNGKVTLAKAASTPADQSLGVMDGLSRLAEAIGHDRATMLRTERRSRHNGRRNALLEMKGPASARRPRAIATSSRCARIEGGSLHLRRHRQCWCRAAAQVRSASVSTAASRCR
jgi:hypothetical protein